MKRIILCLLFGVMFSLSYGQEYTIMSGGQSKDGNYIVDVTVSSKKKIIRSAEDIVMQYAVHGVLFRGITSTEGYGSQSPLVKDPNIEQTKSEFFDAFFNEGAYKRYASIVGSSLTIMKNKQTKKNEITATVIVKKGELVKYLEESGIIKGFSNLW